MSNDPLDPEGTGLPNIVYKTIEELRESIQRVPALSGEPTDEHHNAVRAALYVLSVGTTTWSEKLDREGNVVRLKSAVLPDRNAAQLWLEAHKPERWSKQLKLTHEVGETLETLILKSMSASLAADETRVVSHQ